jgi:gas vesicle protein
MKKVIKKKKSGMSGGKILAGVAGAAALGAGAYYLLGPKAKVHQKKAKALMVKMQKEVEREIKKAKENSGPMYHKAVDMISENYAKQYEMHEPEIKAFAKKLKREWKGAVKKATKKPTKKSTKVSKKKK